MEAISLFSRYAFGRENPVQGYEELSGKVVRYAAGLPLTIEVLGSFLCGKDKLEWVDVIDRLKRIPLKETLEKLELSYITLEDEYKEIFLDIACMLKGKTKVDAISILECCGFHARIGLKVLEQRSLITISKRYEFLGMHDHLEEMGKNIVRRSHPDEPNKHSRLWIVKEIQDILANDMGTEETRCLKLHMPRVNVRILMKGLGKMKKLRYLEVIFYGRNHGSDPKLDDTTQYFPNSLKYLRCCYYPYLYLPKTFQANNLVGLDMYDSRMVQLWEKGEEKVLKKLKFLSVEESNLMAFDFRITPNLETLYLTNKFHNLVELLMPVSCQKLKHLNISRSMLITSDLGLTPNLETLILRSSDKLVELFMPVCRQKIKHLNISHSKLRTIDLELTPNLERLTLDNCADFEELHMSVACPSLKFLNIRDSRLRAFDLGLTPNIEMFSLESCADFEQLHVSVACPNLKTLSLLNCAHFVELHVFAACPNLKNLDLRKSRLRSLDLELIPNLERLDLKGCDELVEINAPVGCLKKVSYLNLIGCLRFPQFVFNGGCEPKLNCSLDTLDMVVECLDSCPLHPNSNLPKLRFPFYCGVHLSSSGGIIEKIISFGLCVCTDLKKISDIICSFQKLTLRGDIPEFPKDLSQLECVEVLCLSSTKIKHLPDSICMLKRLKSLEVNNGDLLEKLPEDLGQLECLEMLHVRSKKIKFLPDSICLLKRLKYLILDRCALLEKLPEDLDQLECLEMLHVRSEKIEFLPDSICLLKRMKYLILDRCALLEKLPEDLGQLEWLEKLHVSSKQIEYLPESICMLKHLKSLDVTSCCRLEKLPEDLGRLECLEELDITYTSISHLPQSIFGLKGLLICESPEQIEYLSVV